MNEPSEKLEDQVTKEVRKCANCACFHFLPVPNNPQAVAPVCRLNPPQHKQMRVERPRMSRDGSAPVMGKDGKVIMEAAVADVLFYPPMDPDVVCFDGW